MTAEQIADEIAPFANINHAALVALIDAGLHAALQEQKIWRCFHCDEVFTDPAEAKEHFGTRRDADVAACQLTLDDVKALRALEAVNERLRCENEELDNTARLYHEQCAEIQRLIGNRSLFMELDYRNGEKIVLEAHAAALADRLTRLEKYLRHLKECESLRPTIGDGYIYDGPSHVCGLMGWNPMIDPPCPGCVARRDSQSQKYLRKPTCSCGLTALLALPQDGEAR